MKRTQGDTGKDILQRGATIWIDLDNTPHVPFFIPVARELRRRGYKVVMTARDAFQVCDLADHHGLVYRRVGRHYGKHMLLKLIGLVWRSVQLLPFVLKERPDIALSHGARSQIFLCNVMRIPTILITDYEHSQTPPFCRPRWELVPDALPDTGLHSAASRVRKYPGIKEDVYVPDFRPDPSLPGELGLRPEACVVTVRPPANEAHYHNPESEVVFDALMRLLVSRPDVQIVLLPRNLAQESRMRAGAPEWFEHGKTIVPQHAVDGLNLLWYSDLVVSGGGTMNREAAALGIPVYSIFLGKSGAVDRRLEQDGRLTMIRSVRELTEKIAFCRRDKRWVASGQSRAALGRIADHVEWILREELPGSRTSGNPPNVVGAA